MADAPKVYRSKGSFAHTWNDQTVEAWMPNEEISAALAGTPEREAYARTLVAAGLIEEVPAGEAKETSSPPSTKPGRGGGR
jgi:hypothetical protein